MSLSFAISEFIVVGDLALRLYRDCYMIARGAPQEFQMLVSEMSTLSHSVNILQEEVKDPTSTLVQAGEDRVRMVNEMISRIGETLKSLDKVAKKYEILGSGSKRRQIWTKFKWSVDFSKIDGLRNKLVYHNTVMTLLLTAVGNSSLQRIESSTAALENDMQAIKVFIAHHQYNEVSDEKASEGLETKPMIPSVSAIDDESFKISLSAALMRGAEATQPWSTIGVDQWIESGRWWLLRSQMELSTLTVPQQKISLAAYANLIKASWILVDIIACHPQVPYIKASTHLEVQRLSAELKNEFSRLSALQSIVPDLSELEGQDLRIWETQAREPLLRLHKNSRRLDEWTVDGGEQVLFQRFALCKLRVLTESLPCILLFLVSRNGRSARIITKNQNGDVCMAISFQTPVNAKESDNSVKFEGNKVTFNTLQDAQHLGCLIRATNFYYFGRKAQHTSLEDLEAYVLITAVKDQKQDVIEQLFQKISLKSDARGCESDESPVVVASMLASQRIRHQLIDVSEPGPRDISLFCWAVQCRLAPLVKVLLIEHPIIDGKGWQGMTPLGFASSCGYEPVVRLLIGSGTDVHATDNSGRSALRSAAQNGHKNVVQVLVERGADIDEKDGNGYTLLCRLCKAQNQEPVITLLLETGANVNLRNRSGMNATHFALESQMSESTVRAILAKQLRGRDHIRDDAELRREKVVLECDANWLKFYLDSRDATIEMPKDTPSTVKCAYNRMISITSPSGPDKNSKFEFDFVIVYHENALDFSVDYGVRDMKEAKLRIKIGNWWETRDTRWKYRGRNLRVFTDVEQNKAHTAETFWRDERISPSLLPP